MFLVLKQLLPEDGKVSSHGKLISTRNLDNSLSPGGNNSCNLNSEDEERTKNKSLFVDAISTSNNSVTGLDSRQSYVAKDSCRNNSKKQYPSELVKNSLKQKIQARPSYVRGVLRMQDKYKSSLTVKQLIQAKRSNVRREQVFQNQDEQKSVKQLIRARLSNIQGQVDVKKEPSELVNASMLQSLQDRPRSELGKQDLQVQDIQIDVKKDPRELVNKSMLQSIEYRPRKELGKQVLQMQDIRVDVQKDSGEFVMQSNVQPENVPRDVQNLIGHEKHQANASPSLALFTPRSMLPQEQLGTIQINDNMSRNQIQHVTTEIPKDNNGRHIYTQNKAITTEICEDGNEKVRTGTHAVTMEICEDGDEKVRTGTHAFPMGIHEYDNEKVRTGNHAVTMEICGDDNEIVRTGNHAVIMEVCGDDNEKVRTGNHAVIVEVCGDDNEKVGTGNHAVTIEMRKDDNEKVRTGNHAVTMEIHEDNVQKVRTGNHAVAVGILKDTDGRNGNQNRACSMEAAEKILHTLKTLKKSEGIFLVVEASSDIKYDSMKAIKEPKETNKCAVDTKVDKKSESMKAIKELKELNKRAVGEEFTCDTCNRKFAEYGRICRHVMTHIHNRERYTCEYCPKEFITIEGKNLHEMIHTGETVVECDECGMGFRTWKFLRDHEFKVHKKGLPHLCDVCGRSFSGQNDLKRHSSIHTGEKKFECKLCHKRFTRYSGMTRHLDTHRTLLCDVCAKTFKSKKELRLHKMTHVKKAYQCDQCEASFEDNSYLKRHKITHLELKPFKCHICEAGYAFRSNLNKHLKASHDLTPSSTGWIGIRKA